MDKKFKKESDLANGISEEDDKLLRKAILTPKEEIQIYKYATDKAQVKIRTLEREKKEHKSKIEKNNEKIEKIRENIKELKEKHKNTEEEKRKIKSREGENRKLEAEIKEIEREIQKIREFRRKIIAIGKNIKLLNPDKMKDDPSC